MQNSLFAHVSYVVFDRCPTMFSELKTARLFSAAAMRLGISSKNVYPGGISAELGSGVKIIGQKAFYATNLSTVTIPENVTNIGGMAFGFHTGEKKDTSFIIRGKSGTAAEFYADDNSFIFKPISYDVWLAGTQITVDNIDILTPVIAQNSSEAKERFKNGEMEITFDGKSTLTLKNAIIDTGTKCFERCLII